MGARWKLLILFFILNSLLFAQNIPYPQSSRFDSVIWHWNTYKYLADGSDLWPTTWGYDDNIYTSWGDGGGFDGDDHLGRVSLGFGRIEDSPENFKGFNVWGGYRQENPVTFKGKCNAIISVDSILYALINTQTPQYPNAPDIKLAWSDNQGASWNLCDWVFAGTDSLLPISFINYGRNNNGCRDEYIYITYGKWISSTGVNAHCYLMRVHKSLILHKDKYEFLSGIDDHKNPLWSFNMKDSSPIFTDQNGVDGAELIYNQTLKLYILTVGHLSPGPDFISSTAKLGIFTSPEPWGPWSTVAYYSNWGNFGDIEESLGYHIPTKWISEDGKTFWMIFSSGSYLDRFNIISGRFVETVHDSLNDNTAPSAPYNLNLLNVNEHEISFSWLPSSDPESGISTYRIFKDTVLAAESDTTIFKDSLLIDDTNYTYQVSSVNGVGLESKKSDLFTVQTKSDTIPPQVQNVYFKDDSTKLYVEFSEKVDKTSVEDINNYRITGAIKIYSAELDLTNRKVALYTAPHEKLFSYWIKVKNIFDLARVPNKIKQSSFNYLYPRSSLLENLSVHSFSQYELIESYEKNESIYIDNNYMINSDDYPEIITNPWIRTAYNDRYISREDFLSFNLNLSSDIYILHDNRIEIKPGWLNKFYNTGISTTIGDNRFTFFRKYFEAGKVTFGGNVVEGENCDCGMYIVVIKPGFTTNIKNNSLTEKDFKLYQNYPNPFNPSTFITFSLPESGKVTIRIYNSLGEKIALLRDETLLAGNYKFQWNGKDNNGIILASGVYFCELILQGDKSYKSVNKMIIMK